jgi:zinc transport system substrate-binding protein
VVGGCAGTEGAAETHGLKVTAAFYPLQYAAEQVGGSHVEVTGLTKPGTEPHDLELTPKNVSTLANADLVVYEKGFQPAVDAAVADQAHDAAFDVSEAARLDLAAEPQEHEGESAEEHAAHEGTQDPHFWLDPTKYAAVVTALGARLAALDPANASEYTRRAADLSARLMALDREFETGLARCTSKDLVTSHAAFGYLAARYGLHQEGISGISPDTEPSAAQMREISAHIAEHDVKTVYSETLVSPALAETLARETGASVAVLDPLEGISDISAGKDYFAVMRANLATLQKGQGCS